jgi:hypothetical protein
MLYSARLLSSNSFRLAAVLCALVGTSACSDDDPETADTGTDTAADVDGDTSDVSDEDADAADEDADAADEDVDVEPDGSGDTTEPGDADADEETDAGTERVLDPWPSLPAPPECGTPTDWPGMLPGPGDEGFDEDLATKARRLERQFHVFNTIGVGVNRELSVALENTEDRALIDEFILETDSWDFEDWAERDPAELITSYHKVAGAYGGVGAAADAFRYATLLYEGADCDELERAREFIRADLDALHLATAITGVPGVIARGFARPDQPGTGYDVTPLFDGSGDPLPEEKNNGTWRADNSGLYPDYIWEDSCSRDMLIGWVIGMTAIWEVIADDPNFDDALKERLQADALAIARSLMTVQDSGYDMEVRDADGRMTFHGILHHESLDRVYLPGIKNGFNAMMGLGIMAGFAYITQDEEVEAFVYEELIDERDYLDMVVNEVTGLDLGYGSNFSMYNMIFQGGWLAQRYLRDPAARAEVRRGIDVALYDRGGIRQPREQKQTFFDFTYVASLLGESVYTTPTASLDTLGETAVANGLETLGEWRGVPYWNVGENNCDEAEIESGDCIGADGTEITVLGPIGRNGDLIAEEPVPMRIRPASNYWWRSNPYKPNGGGDGRELYPGSDFRFAYWMGRWFEGPASDSGAE